MANDAPQAKHNYRTKLWNDWCPGCGDFGILASAQMALQQLGEDPLNVVFVTGIGCSGKTSHYVNVTGVHTLHGRALAFATGVKLANPKLKVLVSAGDGDQLGIGAGHYVAMGRRNIPITLMLHNNGVYGLTKGQAAPTLAKGVKTKSLASPNINGAINPTLLALSTGYTFVARAFSYDAKGLTEIIKMAVAHNGAALIDVLQPCITYNDINTREWYQERIYSLSAEGYDGTVKSAEEAESGEKLKAALTKSLEFGDRIPLGVLYKNEFVPSYLNGMGSTLRGYPGINPANEPIEKDGAPLTDLTQILDKLAIV